MAYNELAERGTVDFPIGFYHLEKDHPKYIMQYHWHKEIEIIRIIRGKLAITLNNTELLAGHDDIIFVNSEVVHGAIPHDCIYECVVFDPCSVLLNSEMGKHLALGLTGHNIFIFHRIKSQNIALFSTVNQLFDAFYDTNYCDQLLIIAKIYELFSVILKDKLYSDNLSYGNFLKDKNIIKLKRALEFMRKNYKSQFCLEELSRAVDVSPKYFCVIFKSMTGMTAFEYLNSYRIEKASNLLISTDMTITDIAYSSGFNDLSYFIKTFKKIKQVTPKHFRNSHYRGQNHEK